MHHTSCYRTDSNINKLCLKQTLSEDKVKIVTRTLI